jgi:hypothetical protein
VLISFRTGALWQSELESEQYSAGIVTVQEIKWKTEGKWLNEINEAIKMRNSADIQCCYCLILVIKSRTLNRVSKIKIPRTVLKSVVMCGHETWSSFKKDEVNVKCMGEENSV